MQSDTRTTELPVVLSVRLSRQDYDDLVNMSRHDRRNISQTVRLILERARDAHPVHRPAVHAGRDGFENLVLW